jgi:hypothetical protein
MKQLITPVNIAFFLWGLVLVIIAQLHPEYTRYFLYLSIIVIIPVTVINMIKMKREDKRNGTMLFRTSIYRMLFMAILLGFVFFMTKLNPM